jgi:hypothetical protein
MPRMTKKLTARQEAGLKAYAKTLPPPQKPIEVTDPALVAQMQREGEAWMAAHYRRFQAAQLLLNAKRAGFLP